MLRSIRARVPHSLALMAALLLPTVGCGGGGGAMSPDAAASDAAAPVDAPMSSGRHDLRLRGSGYAPHAGQTIYAALVSSGGSVLERAQAVVTGSSYEIAFAGALETGASYRIDYYADHDGDGRCSAPPADHVWQTAVPSVTDDVVIEDPHDAAFAPAACGSFPVNTFDLTLGGTNYAPHDGQTVRAALLDEATARVVATAETTVSGGVLAISMPGELVEGRAYRLEYYADHNSNGTCDAPPADHVWRQAIPAVTGDVTIERAHAPDFTPAACDAFAP